MALTRYVAYGNTRREVRNGCGQKSRQGHPACRPEAQGPEQGRNLAQEALRCRQASQKVDSAACAPAMLQRRGWLRITPSGAGLALRWEAEPSGCLQVPAPEPGQSGTPLRTVRRPHRLLSPSRLELQTDRPKEIHKRRARPHNQLSLWARAQHAPWPSFHPKHPLPQRPRAPQPHGFAAFPQGSAAGWAASRAVVPLSRCGTAAIPNMATIWKIPRPVAT